MSAPELSELAAVADRAVALLDGEGQASVMWERRVDASGDQFDLSVALTCVIAGRCARVEAGGSDDRALQRAAKAAALRARQARAWPSGGLPEPGPPPPPHEGFDPELLTITPTALVDRLDGAQDARAAATRIAIASTRGVRATEQRTFAATRTQAAATLAAIAPPQTGAWHLVAPLQPSARDLVAPLQPSARHLVAPLQAGDRHRTDVVVLGPVAVAAVLDRLRAAFGVDLALGHGVLAGKEGARVAAEVIDLADDSRHPRTLPRSYDAEGVASEPVTLIAGGIACGGVHDTASAARHGTRTTGHATQPGTLAPMPDHLVLAGGSAAGIEELARPVERGLYLPDLVGAAFAIAGGAIGAEAVTAPLAIDPLAVLAGAQELTRELQTVPLRAHAPGGSGAAVVPALRTAGGVARA